jgi:hypothetical protein
LTRAASASFSGPTQICPRPVFCITGNVHNDRSVAEAVCNGRFTHAGTTLELGTDPDWLTSELPADEEWRIEWSKFYYGLDLANAFCDSGEPRFASAWERLVRSWIKKVPIGSDSSDVAARRMQNWTCAWSLFTSYPGFAGLEEGTATKILLSVADHVDYVREHLTPEVFRNHRTLELYALFIVALAFPQIDPSSELLGFTISELHRNLMEGFRSDGVHREQSTHYHLVVLRSLVGARENARRFELDLPDGFDPLLERACEFALHCHRPDGITCALSDADSGSYPEVLKLAGWLLDRPDFTYAATAGVEGKPPFDRFVGFPEAGYYFQRSGWGTADEYREERFLVFDCGPLGDGGHGHYDLLNVEIFARGTPLIVDPGRYTYSEAGSNLRRWFKGTAAHNTVIVDGMDQTPYRKGRPGERTADGVFVGRRTASGFDILEGTAHSPCYDAVHTRSVLFIADEYWIIEDRLTASTPHRYDLRWHLSPEAWRRTELLTTDSGRVARAPGVALLFLTHDGVELETGWISPRYGLKQRAPVVNVSARGTEVSFLTLVVPQREDRVLPCVEVSSAGGHRETRIVRVGGVGADGLCCDTVAWGPRPEQIQIGFLRCRVQAGWLRVSRAGRPQSFRGFEVSELPLKDGLEPGLVEATDCACWDATGAGLDGRVT